MQGRPRFFGTAAQTAFGLRSADQWSPQESGLGRGTRNGDLQLGGRERWGAQALPRAPHAVPLHTLPPPVTRACCSPRARAGSRVYLQPLQPLAVAVHQPGPPWGQGCSQGGLPRGRHSPPPTHVSGARPHPAPSTAGVGPSPPPPRPSQVPHEAAPRVPTFQLLLCLLKPKLGVRFKDAAAGRREKRVTKTPNLELWAPGWASTRLSPALVVSDVQTEHRRLWGGRLSLHVLRTV